MIHNYKFLLVAVLLPLAFMPGVSAAPAVKILGAKSSQSGYVATNPAKTTTGGIASQKGRAGSIRSVGATMKSPTAVKPATIQSAKAIETPQRLSIGKYIHGQGVTSGAIKPTGNASSGAVVSSQDFISVSERVTELEADKQDKLTAGDGISISDDNVISLTKEFADSKVDVANLAEFYYNKNDIDQMVTNNMNVHNVNGTKADELVIYDTFSPNIFGASGGTEDNEQDGD